MLLTLGGAARASSGWYLMIPPEFNTIDAPMSQHFQWGAYDTAQQCEAEFHNLLRDIKTGTLSTKSESERSAFNQGHCIASDDPRLGR